MKRGLFAVLVIALIGGCTTGEPTNPNLAAPKLVVQPRPDGNVTIFIHSAFGERTYEWIDLSIDNVTVANRTTAYSLETIVPSQGFFAAARAGVFNQTYEARARVDIVEDERAMVAFLDPEGEWTEARSYGLPFGTILERRDTT